MLARMRRIRVAALELSARWGARAAALAEADALVASNAEIDLVLLPEASLTGYVSPSGDFDLRPFAESIDGTTAGELAALARRHRVHLVAPLVERASDGRAYNAMIAFDREGNRKAVYRKRYPWYPETWASAGHSSHPIIDVEGVRVTIAICFDVQFIAREPGRELASALEAADVLLFPSAWVETEDSRAEMLPRIARRFGVAIVNANWGEGSPRVRGQGGSMIVSARGEIVARATASNAASRIDASIDVASNTA
jgi:predicted amidohydrolase